MMSKKIDELIKSELDKYKSDINKINEPIKIDCITIFSTSDNDYNELNDELDGNRLIDRMSSGNLYYLYKPINTDYGELFFIKVRKHDDNYKDYKISVDFTVDNYEEFKSKLNSPKVKTYNSFELIQFKTYTSIINIISLSAIEDYNIKGE